MLKAVNKFSPFELCDRGEYKLAAELAGLTVGEWPERGSQDDSDYAETLLLAGIIQSSVGQIQHDGDQAFAKLVLTKSVQLFGDDTRGLVARSWLAWAQYRDGQTQEALQGVRFVLENRIDPETKFRCLLLQTTIYWKDGLLNQAWDALVSVLPDYEQCGHESKGKFHGHRALILRSLGEIDRAIVEYDSAIHFFAQSGNTRSLAIGSNNLAELYLRTEQFEQARKYADEALRLFIELGDKAYEAEARDTLERIKQKSSVKSGCEYGIHPPSLPSAATATISRNESSKAMTPLDDALLLIESGSEHAEALYDLLVWATSNRDNPQHQAELDKIERTIFSKVPECEEHRENYRRSRLIRPIISDS